jgi:hypothetical protein
LTKEVSKLARDELSKSSAGMAFMALQRAWAEDRAQDIAEYAVMLFVALIALAGLLAFARKLLQLFGFD